MKDGGLREVADGIWDGQLLGWTVRISHDGRGWYVGIGHATKR
jgi:hypothetical protein